MSSSNDDQIIIGKFHGGVATKAFLTNLKAYAKQELLTLPDDMKLYSNSTPTEASHKVYQSFNESSNFMSSFMSSKSSQDYSIGVKIPLVKLPATVGLNYENSKSSGSSNSSGQSNASSKREFSVVIYEYISKGTFDLPPSKIILSPAAERRALRIKSLKDAFEFFDEFGAFYPVCTYTVGGVYLSEVRASGKSTANMNEFSSSASSACSSKVGASIGIKGFELGGSYGTSNSSESGGSQRNSVSKDEVNVEIKCLNYGPQHVNIDEFRKAINQNRNEWTNIGCSLSKLKPIYEIIEDTDNSELSSAVFYLKVAHIVKNLENTMVNQIVKKFENENKEESEFDIDLFLTCLSKDIQEVAIEEFVKMTKSTSSNDDIFKKFEKSMKQVYNKQVNQNLEVIQKILDIELEFPNSSVQINNIYLEKESNFAFTLYYTDKFKRLDPEGWNDYLECMKNLKVKNENDGNYILCNLDLHHEVDDVDEMCLKVYYKGSQKKLMLVNEDFLEHHSIHFGTSKIELKDKEFTYYIEDEVFSKLKNLKSFKLNNSSLRVIRENSFSNLKKLEEIDVSGNKIRMIESRSFSTLTSLTSLNLAKNKIEVDELNEEDYEGLTNLKMLNLASNLIKSLNKSVFTHLVNLRTLSLESNQINSIERDAFKGLENLEDLNLGENKVNYIEDLSFSELQKLKKLILSGNKLAELSENIFSGLVSLNELDLSKNSISEIDNKAFDPFLKTLKKIEIDGNKIDAGILDQFNFESLNK
jgi:hypothetical protein